MTTQSFLAAFAQAIVSRDFGRAEGMLAPWVRESLLAGGVKALINVTLGDNPPAVEVGIASLPYETPASMREHVSERDPEDAGRTLESADGTGAIDGPPSFPIPQQLTDQNFAGCFRLEFQPDEDLESDVDYSFALYVVVVTEQGAQLIGFIEPME